MKHIILIKETWRLNKYKIIYYKKLNKKITLIKNIDSDQAQDLKEYFLNIENLNNFLSINNEKIHENCTSNM